MRHIAIALLWIDNHLNHGTREVVHRWNTARYAVHLEQSSPRERTYDDMCADDEPSCGWLPWLCDRAVLACNRYGLHDMA